MTVVAIVTGLALLAWAPGRFVGGAAELAERWRVSPVLIGALVIGLGTSAPEMLVSGLAALQGDPAVGAGNIVGSNIANLGLILGVAGLVGSISVTDATLRTEVPLVAAATVAFALAVQGGVSVGEGLALLAGLAGALAVIVRRSQAAGAAGTDLEEDVEEFLAHRSLGTGRLVAALALGLGGIIGGAQALVWGAIEVADALDLSGGFVGMTLVAVGTSIPELVTAVAAVRAGEDELVVGNVLGSNLFNCLAVGAVVGLAGAGPLDDTTLTTGGVALMLGVTAVAAAALAIGRRVTRLEAAGLLATYLVVMPLLAR
ncbi:MAG TPA: sodium:calcium antiporter [Acidimicrobiales bacterium]|nr:sodium:calcium antiporter [Acidimicrobiales bacterium]